jgi:hypothetical protein
VAVGFNLQDKLNEVAQLQRLPEGFRRLMGDDVAVFGNRQQFVAADSRDSAVAISRASAAKRLL